MYYSLEGREKWPLFSKRAWAIPESAGQFGNITYVPKMERISGIPNIGGRFTDSLYKRDNAHVILCTAMLKYMCLPAMGMLNY